MAFKVQQPPMISPASPNEYEERPWHALEPGLLQDIFTRAGPSNFSTIASTCTDWRHSVKYELELKPAITRFLEARAKKLPMEKDELPGLRRMLRNYGGTLPSSDIKFVRTFLNDMRLGVGEEAIYNFIARLASKCSSVSPLPIHTLPRHRTLASTPPSFIRRETMACPLIDRVFPLEDGFAAGIDPSKKPCWRDPERGWFSIPSPALDQDWQGLQVLSAGRFYSEDSLHNQSLLSCFNGQEWTFQLVPTLLNPLATLKDGRIICKQHPADPFTLKIWISPDMRPQELPVGTSLPLFVPVVLPDQKIAGFFIPEGQSNYIIMKVWHEWNGKWQTYSTNRIDFDISSHRAHFLDVAIDVFPNGQFMLHLREADRSTLAMLTEKNGEWTKTTVPIPADVRSVFIVPAQDCCFASLRANGQLDLYLRHPKYAPGFAIVASHHIEKEDGFIPLPDGQFVVQSKHGIFVLNPYRSQSKRKKIAHCDLADLRLHNSGRLYGKSKDRSEIQIISPGALSPMLKDSELASTE